MRPQKEKQEEKINEGKALYHTVERRHERGR